jgi:hypothetical protein
VLEACAIASLLLLLRASCTLIWLRSRSLLLKVRSTTGTLIIKHYTLYLIQRLFKTIYKSLRYAAAIAVL